MSFSLKVVKSTSRFLGLVAPNVAARRLVSLFLTPASSGQRSSFDAALQGETENIQFDDEWLPIFRFNSNNATRGRVLLCHGWRGRGQQFSAFVKAFTKAGYEVITFDGPAHGESQRRKTNMVHFSEFLLAVDQHVGGFDAALGHSFGASALIYAMHRGLKLRQVVLIAPYDSVPVAFGQFSKILDVSPAQQELALLELRTSFAEHLDAWDLAELVQGNRTHALLVHDEDDNQIPIKASQTLAKAWSAAEVYQTRGLGHNRVLSERTVVDRATCFLLGKQR